MARKKFELSAESIRKFRNDRGLSRSDLGKALEGTSIETIKNWETGKATPPAYLRLALLYLMEKSLVRSMKQFQREQEEEARRAREAVEAQAAKESTFNPFA
jgi:transcriptional regulator with XRE-family HTH domain